MAWVRGADAVDQALWTLLLTEPGERIARPTYGCGLRQFLFAPNNVTTRTLVQRAVERSIRVNEPRVSLKAVVVSTDSLDSTELRIDVTYVLVGDSDPRNLVFPFYLDDGTKR